MRKKTLLGVLGLVIALSSAGYAKSGVFVGGNLGLPITAATDIPSLVQPFIPTTGVGYTVGVNVGYKQDLTTEMGLKYYLSYNFSQSFASKAIGPIENKADILNHLVVANVDYFYDFDKMFGAYVGIGLGYSDYSGSFNIANIADFGISGGSFALPINVGVNFNINESNTISLGAKIPVLGTDVNVLGATAQKVQALQNGGGESSSSSSTTTDGEPAALQVIKGGTLRNYIIQLGYTYTF
ncbi:outer membrane beta-barrel protein [Helicobacter sp. 11S02629-2]|uniref:outer membrane beta-barrel protein n=1 Tax=Helicobacter sp. 11S02629-2 TaxID=1476195 RepID=UPI000BA785A6|nr:outer membrane beta-barrel protein [Helicobacter sp. 11S02629-2]PAF45458.1 hypothetical protein BKH40_03040 [Helicobacter sp. 11S02629-2]